MAHLIDIAKTEAHMQHENRRILGLKAIGQLSSHEVVMQLNEVASYQRDTIPQIKAIHHEVDLDRRADPYFRQKMENPDDPRILYMSGCIHPYLVQGAFLQELTLIQTPGLSYEPALFYMYHGDHGVLACVHGLRHRVQHTYAAGHTVIGARASAALASMIIPPVYIGSSMCFRGAPVYVPSKSSWEQLEKLIDAYLAPSRSIHGGFFGSTPDDWLHVFGLCHPSWLSKVEQIMAIER